MTSQQLTLGPLVYSDMLGAYTPSTITVPEGHTFIWDEGDGCYASQVEEQVYLYMEDEVITTDTWYELHTD